MKLAALRIEMFRALRKSEIRVGSELALVGQNSAGKSSVLRALNAFFNFKSEMSSFEEGRHTFQKSSTSIIEVEFNNVPSICTIPRIARNSGIIRLRLKYKKSDVWQVFNNGSWVSAPQDFHNELEKYIRYAYIPLRRDHEISAWGSNGLLQNVVEAWVKNQTKKRDTISPKVTQLSKTIKTRTLDGLSKHLRSVTPLNGTFTFQLDYLKQPDYSLLIRDLVLKVSEGTTTVDLEDCGSGTQSMTAFALYSYLAELEGSTYILGIEEPEQNLHPQAQRILLQNLKKLPLQVLFTTHSTVLVDQLRHDEVVLCRRSVSATRGIEITTTQLPSTFWTTNGLDEQRYYQFHHRRNSEFFFANFIILTESPIDAEIIKALLIKTNTPHDKYGVSILSLDGVQSLPYAYHLLEALNLDFATIVDKDYFLPYLNDELENSRDARGFPRYRRELKAGNLLVTMVPNSIERTNLQDLFLDNHSRAMDILEKSNIFCFKWSLEVDLVNSTTARQLLFQNLNVPLANQTTKELLIAKKNLIKKLETIMPIINTLQPTNLPNSYKRLRKTLPVIIRKVSDKS